MGITLIFQILPQNFNRIYLIYNNLFEKNLRKEMEEIRAIYFYFHLTLLYGSFRFFFTPPQIIFALSKNEFKSRETFYGISFLFLLSLPTF